MDSDRDGYPHVLRLSFTSSFPTHPPELQSALPLHLPALLSRSSAPYSVVAIYASYKEQVLRMSSLLHELRDLSSSAWLADTSELPSTSPLQRLLCLSSAPDVKLLLSWNEQDIRDMCGERKEEEKMMLIMPQLRILGDPTSREHYKLLISERQHMWSGF